MMTAEFDRELKYRDASRHLLRLYSNAFPSATAASLPLTTPLTSSIIPTLFPLSNIMNGKRRVGSRGEVRQHQVKSAILSYHKPPLPQYHPAHAAHSALSASLENLLVLSGTLVALYSRLHSLNSGLLSLTFGNFSGSFTSMVALISFSSEKCRKATGRAQKINLEYLRERQLRKALSQKVSAGTQDSILHSLCEELVQVGGKNNQMREMN